MGDRTSADWLAALRGDQGQPEQAEAYADLAEYLHIIIYNYLLRRRSSLLYLAQLDNHDLSELASDFVQDTLLRFAQDLLEKYRPTGRFTSWAAKVATREAGQQLRRHEWARKERLEPAPDADDSEDGFAFPQLEGTTGLAPERASICSDIWNTIQQAFEAKLGPRQRKALAMRLQGATTSEIAEALETTNNNVYILTYQARKVLKEEMLTAGYTMQEILEAFEED